MSIAAIKDRSSTCPLPKLQEAIQQGIQWIRSCEKGSTACRVAVWFLKVGATLLLFLSVIGIPLYCFLHREYHRQKAEEQAGHIQSQCKARILENKKSEDRALLSLREEAAIREEMAAFARGNIQHLKHSIASEERTISRQERKYYALTARLQAMRENLQDKRTQFSALETLRLDKLEQLQTCLQNASALRYNINFVEKLAGDREESNKILQEQLKQQEGVIVSLRANSRRPYLQRLEQVNRELDTYRNEVWRDLERERRKKVPQHFLWSKAHFDESEARGRARQQKSRGNDGRIIFNPPQAAVAPKSAPAARVTVQLPACHIHHPTQPNFTQQAAPASEDMSPDQKGPVQQASKAATSQIPIDLGAAVAEFNLQRRQALQQSSPFVPLSQTAYAAASPVSPDKV